MFNLSLIFFSIILIYGSYGQSPRQCTPREPFRMTDKTCANFNEICIKSDNEQCAELLNACKQCPPNNFTITIMMDVMKVLSEQQIMIKQNLKVRFDEMKDQLNSKTEIKDLKAVSTALLGIIFVLIIIVIIILLVEARFKLNSWKRHSRMVKNKYNNEVHSNANDKLLSPDHELKNLLEVNRKEDYKYMVNEIKLIFDEKIKLLIGENIFQKVKFQIVYKIIEVNVKKDDNIVQIKRKICTKWISAKENDDKRMKLKYNGIILDDNDYLLKQIGSNNDVIKCDIDDAINVNNIIIVRLQSNIPIPKFIQINKDKTIADLKIIIKTIIKSDNFIIYFGSKQLENEIIKNLNIINDDIIKIISKELVEIKITSIFDDNEMFIKHSNIDNIISIKSKIASEIKSKNEDLILFHNNKYLKNEDLIFNVGIENESNIKYYFIMSCDLIEIGDKITEGENSTILKARRKWDKKEIILKRFDFDSNTDLKLNKALLNELSIFQVTKSHPRFIQLSGICKDKEYVYISMEKMTGSIKTYQTKNGLLLENEIARLSKQILEALKFLHDHQIIHRNLKPSNILIDDNNNVKLSSFGISKYAQGYEPDFLDYGFSQSKIGTMRYMSPEILKNDKYGVAADVWSFGCTMLEIISGKYFLSQFNEAQVSIEIGDNSNLKYDFPINTSNQLKQFIDQCLQIKPENRSTIESLLKNDFLLKHQ